MKLLIFTQTVDVNDSISGFFHSWIERFARECESVTVICLKEGGYKLPKNVKVFSLGKEKGVGRFRYILNFYKYLFLISGTYDSVFIHMNQEYAILGGLWWKLIRVKTSLWRNHTNGSLLTDLASIFVQKIFYTSKYAYVAKKKKAICMPAGIDTDFFHLRGDWSEVSSRKILFLGRISPVKKVMSFIEALLELKRNGTNFRATLCGDPTLNDIAYAEKIKVQAMPLKEDSFLDIISGVPHKDTREIYASHDLYVNLTQTGSLDKTVLEAMASGSLALVSNQTFRDILPDYCVLQEKVEPQDISRAITLLLNLSSDEKKEQGKKNREYVLQNHSLQSLFQRLMEDLS